MQPVMPPELDDEALLDLLFDRIVDLLEDGASPCAAELAGDRPHLLHRVEELIRLAQQVKPEAGQPLPQIPGYTVLRELGRGGMGAVYLARQERLGGRPVALKLLPAGVALSSKARQRFRDEAHAIARLSHPNIVAVHDVVSADGLHAYAMEWVDGQSLADWISERCGGHTDVVFVCRVGVAVARALHAVHAAGLLHRDVKPSNILLRRDGTPLLSDFGLVREADATLTHAGHFAGTMAYSSPEQLRGQPENLDSRSDVYALGVTLYHALALRLPFAAQRPEVVVQQIEGGAAPPLRTFAPRVPVDLQTIVAKAMDQDPARRYDTAAELADDLERLLSLQPIKARPAGLMTRAIKLARRKRGALAAGAAGATLTGAVLVALGVYVFLVPRWVEWHLTKARLALLHPDQASTLHWSHFAETPTWALSATFLNQSAIDGALAHYDAALRWSPFDDDIRAERAIVRSASAPGQASPIADSPQDSIVRASHVRLAGLRAFLLWDTDAAIESWSRYESLQDQVREPDPFVAAALGLLYLVEEHPARAYPRLRDAVQGFPEVGFLTVYLADAAVQCNDLSEAHRNLDRARALPGLDGHRGLERVEADLLAAEGRPERG
ncbi:MAG: serine/threonine protein kinase [Phycisphaerae bacterium]|nr:serine/threonine protein kinase [Phycisphaerae bacterium]NUQ46122.1 serine/threonine protein kinase [Phycisphaerae bacterium]